MKVPWGGGSGGTGLGSSPSTEVGFGATSSLHTGQGGGLRALVWLAEGRGCSERWDPCGHPCVRGRGCQGCEAVSLPPALPPPARD